MKITVEHRGKKYEVTSCGPRCSFAKKDGDVCSCVLKEWEMKHCTKRCYLPEWYTNPAKYVFAECYALHEIKDSKK